MSKANIQGQSLDFNIGFLTKSKTNDENEPEYARVDTGALTYLEIEDNLLNVGLTGSISVKNPFQILDRIEALRSTEDTLYLNVNVEDKDSQVKSIVDKKVSFLALIENSASISKNILDNEIVFKFEEAQTSMLKKTSMQKVYPHIGQKEGSLGVLIKSIIEGWTGAIREAADTLIDEDNFVSESGGTGDIMSFCDDIGDSVHEVLMRLAGCIHINDKLLPILKIQSLEVDGNIERKFTFKEIFTERHHEFLKTVGTAAASNSSDVYLEEFVISPEDDKSAGVNSSGMFNTVETYDMLKADIAVARDKFWGDHLLDIGDVDISKTNIELLTLSEIVNNFEANDLGGIPEFYSSIPVLSDIERKIIKSEKRVNITDNTIIRDYAFNRAKRSFLFLNDAIIFTVKGQMFRKPGNFITINGGDVIGSTAPKNIWLIISIKHLFKELNYENEVVAVRLFGNSKQYSDLVGEESSLGSSGGSSGGEYYAPAGASNLTPVGDVNQTGVVDRSKVNEELKNDPDLQRLLYASTQAEVGAQGEVAQQGYMESVMNRAAASGRSLRSILSDTGYYPPATKNKLKSPNPTDYNTQLQKVLAGSNITNYATDNASSGLAVRRTAANNPGVSVNGELFYSNYYGSGGGGVPKYRVWREGQIKSVRVGNTGT